jgi:hypothetical protein
MTADEFEAVMSKIPSSQSTMGADGIPMDYLRGRDGSGTRCRRGVERYRSELEGLSDRHLARRYARYLRLADRVGCAFHVERKWSVRGLLAQATRRLHAAHRLLKERGLHVPERGESWKRAARAEIYNENLGTFDALRTLPTEVLEARLANTERALAEDPTSFVLLQRQMLLWGELEGRKRTEAARDLAPMIEVSATQARILREAVIQELSPRVGYEWTPTEADALLRGIGIITTRRKENGRG